MTRTPALGLLLAAATTLVATGCTATPPGPSDTSPPAASPAAEAPCFVGEWTLDLDAVAEQAIETLARQGLDVDRLALDGRQTLTIADPDPEAGTGEFTVDSELTAMATVSGEPVDVPLSGSGSGVYALDDDASFVVESWTFDADEDTTIPLGLPFLGESPVTVDSCSESELVLTASAVDGELFAPYSRED